MLNKAHRIHLVGIGGIGMSGLAKILANLGYTISGSDLCDTFTTKFLKSIGVKIYIGHDRTNINNIDTLVISSAVSKSNVEVKEALRKNIPIIYRADMLSEILSSKRIISIAGSHGKTTTTALIAIVLLYANFDPTILAGGILNNINTNATLGNSDYAVIETDESDGSFLKFSSYISVVTNIDNDHLEHYDNDIKNLKKAFFTYIDLVSNNGISIVCYDNASIRDILKNKNLKNNVTYGIYGNPNVKAVNIKIEKGFTSFIVIYNGKRLGSIIIKILGLHNILNALAAISVGLCLDIPFKSISKAIKHFSGVKRRLEFKGVNNKIIVIDDYAHHPTEIKNTIRAIKIRYPTRRLIVLFQPHRYTRTHSLFQEFCESFSNVDMLKILDIYSAGETPIKGVTSDLLVKNIKSSGYVSKFSNLADLKKVLIEGDIVLTIGAGDVWKIGEKLLTI